MSKGSLPEVGPVCLSLGFHDHQPTGNFPWVYAEHYERAYLPFLEAMERHPDVPFSLHLTGPLLLWLAEERHEYLARLRALVAAGRLELKGGGFYEPILALIPDDDKREQLRRMTGYLMEHLGTAPTGAWIAERVWEPHLARVLAEAGLEYAVLDDSHFLAAGVDPEDTTGYYVTEEQGWRFDLFPISKELRYLIPFHEPAETIAYLRGLGERRFARPADASLPPIAPPPLAVYDDDGEKFGGWPGTHQHVYGSGWLERFLCALEEAAGEGWLHLTTLGAYRRDFAPLGRIYIPTGSYAEMQEWSGGFFRNFLVRYDEANLLHKRMLYTSGKVRRRLDVLGAPSHHDAPDPPADPGCGDQSRAEPGRGGLPDALLAWDHVLRAQCNDPYWHGVFGGLYLPHLRQAAYADLLSAERLLGPAAGPELEVLDLDVDGAEEVLLRSTELVAVIRPARGGALAAFDHLPSATALLDILRRRREPEHAALEELAARRRPAATPAGDAAEATDTLGPPAPTDTPLTDGPRTIHGGVRMKEPGLERLLFVDSHPRGAFIDHFFPAGTTVSSIHEGRARELGDFIDTPYAAAGRPEIPGDSPDDPPAVLLTRQGTVAGHEVHLEKTYRLESGADHGLAVTYRLTIGGAAPSTEPRGPATAPTVELRGPATAQSMELPGAGGGSPPAFVMFAPEVDLTLLAGWSAERYVMVDGAEVSHPHLADIDSHLEAQSVELVDQTRGLAVRLSWSTTTPPNGLSCLHRYGIVTVSQSEDGFERIYQGTALLPSWTIPLNEESSLRIRFRLEVLTA